MSSKPDFFFQSASPHIILLIIFFRIFRPYAITTLLSLSASKKSVEDAAVETPRNLFPVKEGRTEPFQYHHLATNLSGFVASFCVEEECTCKATPRIGNKPRLFVTPGRAVLALYPITTPWNPAASNLLLVSH